MTFLTVFDISPPLLGGCSEGLDAFSQVFPLSGVCSEGLDAFKLSFNIYQYMCTSVHHVSTTALR